MPTFTPKRTQQGFTLLEVLLAAVLVSSLAIVAAISLNRSSGALHESTSISEAQTVANNALEQVRQAAYSGASLCEADLALEPVKVNGTTYHPELALKYLYEDATTAQAQDVDCADARAVHATVDVTWVAPAGQDVLSNSVSTTISLVDLQAPSLVTLFPDRTKVAAGQEITLTWSEGDTLPIPEYTIALPDEPNPGFNVTWNGPSPWLGEGDPKTLTVTGPDGFELNHTVTQDRSNTASFIATRNGVHTLTARNIVGETTASVDANVVFPPKGEFNAPNAIMFGEAPVLQIHVEDRGFDDEVRFTAEGPEGYSASLGVQDISDGIVTFEVPTDLRPRDFAARYTVAIENTYTDVFGHTPDSSATHDIACFAPQIDVGASTFARDAWVGMPYDMHLTVLPNNVPDLVVVATRNGEPVAPLAPVGPVTGKDPVKYHYQVVPERAGTDDWRFEVRSDDMCTAVRPVFQHPVPIRVETPPTPADRVSATCSVDARYSPGFLGGRDKVTVTYAASAGSASGWFYETDSVDKRAWFTGEVQYVPELGTRDEGFTAGRNNIYTISVAYAFRYVDRSGATRKGWYAACTDSDSVFVPAPEEDNGGGGNGSGGGGGGAGDDEPDDDTGEEQQEEPYDPEQEYCDLFPNDSFCTGG